MKTMRVDGVDISHWQKDLGIEWGKAKEAGVKWLYHKATEGSTVVDQWYNKRRSEARNHGMPFGAYHFARPDGDDAVREAQAFLKAAVPAVDDLRPCLDLETMGNMTIGEIKAWTWEWCAYVEKHTGTKAVIYTPYDLGAVGAGHVIWRPRYNDSNTPPELPWDIWQFSNGRLGQPNSVDGIGKVDLNVMRAGLSLGDLLIRKPKPQPEPVEPPPVAPPRDEELRVMQSSMQFSDSKAEVEEDAKQVFEQAVKHRVDVVAFSETTRGSKVFDALRDAAFAAGWWFQEDITGDARFAVAPDNKVLESGYTHVLDAHTGNPKGNYSKRGIAEVTFRTAGGNVITDHTTHWLTSWALDKKPGLESPREDKHDQQTAAMVERVHLHGQGQRISIWQGDTNVNEEKDTGWDPDALHAVLEAAGLESIFDALYAEGADLPGTHGSIEKGKTIDIIGHRLGDGRMIPTKVKVFARRGRNADHLIVIATYSIKPMAK